MPSVNVFWAACVASVSITCSSCRRSSFIVSCVPMSSTSIKPDRIKALDNRSQITMASLVLQIERMARSSPCQSWVDYTTITAEVLELYMLTTEQMVALGGAHLIKELAYLRSFLPSCTEKDNIEREWPFLVRTLKA